MILSGHVPVHVIVVKEVINLRGANHFCDLPPKVRPQLSEKVYKTSIFIRIVID